MNDLGNKEVMSQNLQQYMREKNVKAGEISRAINVPYTTVVSWIKGDNYPRIDKIELLAEYFGIMKSDLIEKKEKPTATVSDGQSDIDIEISKMLELLSPEQKKMFLDFLTSLLNKQEP